MTVTDDLTALTATGYWAASDTVSEVAALNNGAFEVPEGSLFLINFSDGEGFFTLNTATDTFEAELEKDSEKKEEQEKEAREVYSN